VPTDKDLDCAATTEVGTVRGWRALGLPLSTVAHGRLDWSVEDAHRYTMRVTDNGMVGTPEAVDLDDIGDRRPGGPRGKTLMNLPRGPACRPCRCP
jgi:hypothetical protein